MSDHTWTENCVLCGGHCRLGRTKSVPPPVLRPDPADVDDCAPPPKTKRK